VKGRLQGGAPQPCCARGSGVKRLELDVLAGCRGRGLRCHPRCARPLSLEENLPSLPPHADLGGCAPAVHRHPPLQVMDQRGRRGRVWVLSVNTAPGSLLSSSHKIRSVSCGPPPGEPCPHLVVKVCEGHMPPSRPPPAGLLHPCMHRTSIGYQSGPKEVSRGVEWRRVAEGSVETLALTQSLSQEQRPGSPKWSPRAVGRSW